MTNFQIGDLLYLEATRPVWIWEWGDPDLGPLATLSDGDKCFLTCLNDYDHHEGVYYFYTAGKICYINSLTIDRLKRVAHEP